MKIEKRGKYSGVKVHLDADECKELLGTQRLNGHAGRADAADGLMIKISTRFVGKLGRKIQEMLAAYPALLKDRTDDEVREQLDADINKMLEQRKALEQGKNWKGI
jgi:hypothetical protein